ncbi:hypothetical protein [Roseiconus lacunae]|uniref:hypothetical protein n=1 Tax=Roseiconus lacunae TaxID=2605694 RepID=UPI0011F3CD8D|nr:hypothetical protein [Roseiconus lacunae]MCD0462981.1 hypothetical protein [Roseiconus lacunae]WRQ49090.1 hypothetical protein U8335_19275 [Stieleria sp. HD01]
MLECLAAESTAIQPLAGNDFVSLTDSVGKRSIEKRCVRVMERKQWLTKVTHGSFLTEPGVHPEH